MSATLPLVSPRLTDQPKDDDHSRDQRLARLTGLLFLLTYATSIPPVVYFYGPALGDPSFVLGHGYDWMIANGALFELVLILANIGTALTLYPVLRRSHPVLALGFLAARLVESGFIALGIVSLLAMNTLRLDAGQSDPETMLAVGKALVAVHDWTFRLGPGVVVGIGNGLILGYLMWQTRLVPRFLSILGLIGGPCLLVAGGAMVLGYIEIGSLPQIIATTPEFFWELLLGLWLLVKGFSARPRQV